MQWGMDIAGAVATGADDDAARPARPLMAPPLAAPGTAMREALDGDPVEQHLIDRVVGVFHDAGYAVDRAEIVGYYVSLKTNPFVLLAGPQGTGKRDFVSLFAEGLLGAGSAQLVRIASGGAWLDATGHDQFYREFVGRFTSLQFVDTLREAAEPRCRSRLYLVAFDALRPEEFTSFFTTLLAVDDAGRMLLTIPGAGTVGAITLPENVLLTATIDTAAYSPALTREVARHAALIAFREPRRAAPNRRAALPPPLGYQWSWRHATIRDPARARARLAAVLGAEQLTRLHCSPGLARLLWQGGIVLGGAALTGITLHVANSFDRHGRGLYDPGDPLRNAQQAYDAQVIQRVLWRTRHVVEPELRAAIAAWPAACGGA
jgi:hypothetical protein